VDFGATGRQPSTASPSFYKARRRIYGVLLIFIIVVGLPVATVPALRNRLLARIHVLKMAIVGDTSPDVVQLGKNQEPFPSEYERPAPVLPQFAMPKPETVHTTPQGGYTLPRAAVRSVPKTAADKVASALSAEIEEAEEQSESDATPDNEPRYQKGKAEQEAYDLLVNFTPAIAGLVQGSNPALRFVSWDAAGRGEDVYWVRLKFQSDNGKEAEYIWQVKLQSKQIAPLNYNARTIP
jgi:hypothetical protein